jgi:hypothetical protein
MQDERIERLEKVLGTLVGSLWAAGTLDEEAKNDLLHLIDCAGTPSKPVQSVQRKKLNFIRGVTG